MVLRAVFQTTAFRCGDNGAVMIVIVAVSFFTERLIKWKEEEKKVNGKEAGGRKRHTSKNIISLVLSPPSFSGFHCADDFSSHNGIIINCRLPVSTFSLHEPSQALEYLLSSLDLIITITFLLHY
ncbi:hypothetical protein P8452_28284 [Trifolium repens]|nr:hypothetical protein P8452_28284 [Trifolium repens]